MKQYLLNNKWAFVLALLVYSLFLVYSFTGSRICDCESTEKYNSGSSRGHNTVNRFYHK
ncbi:hypothetical protein [Flavobacterium sp.]|uniref:hypothetical protein n=1 Tax=Flavobacterium sp. TaxID=239 RepID=UPI0037BFF447